MNFIMRKHIVLLIAITFSACSQEPQPINYGKDECSECKMTIMDEKFATEIITSKGKVFKFDDLVCMVQFINSGVVKENETAKKLVINYEDKNDFLDVEMATFCFNEDLRSPMGGNTAAFQSNEAAIAFKKDKPGVILKWDEVKINSN